MLGVTPLYPVAIAIESRSYFPFKSAKIVKALLLRNVTKSVLIGGSAIKCFVLKYSLHDHSRRQSEPHLQCQLMRLQL